MLKESPSLKSLKARVRKGKPKLGGLRVSRQRTALKRRQKDGQTEFLRLLIRHYGGIVKLADHIAEKTGEPFHWQNFVNWRLRGGVAISQITEIATALELSPYVLNYRKWMRVIPISLTWEQAVNQCDILPKEIRKQILTHKHPKI